MKLSTFSGLILASATASIAVPTGETASGVANMMVKGCTWTIENFRRLRSLPSPPSAAKTSKATDRNRRARMLQRRHQMLDQLRHQREQRPASHQMQLRVRRLARTLRGDRVRRIQGGQHVVGPVRCRPGIHDTLRRQGEPDHLSGVQGYAARGLCACEARPELHAYKAAVDQPQKVLAR